MRTATLTRLRTGDTGTFGVLVLDRGTSFVTGELPWRDNLPGASCIPPGTYLCVWAFSPAHNRNIYHVTNVLGRSSVEIHAGNWCGDPSKGYRSDVRGCIILGQQVAAIEGQEGATASKMSVSDFEAEMATESFNLTIQNKEGV